MLDFVGVTDVIARFVEGVFVTGRTDLDHINFLGVLQEATCNYVVDYDLEGKDC